MTVEVSTPVEFQGAVMGIISRRSGIVGGSEGKEGWVTLEAEVTNLNCILFSEKCLEVCMF